MEQQNVVDIFKYVPARRLANLMSQTSSLLKLEESMILERAKIEEKYAEELEAWSKQCNNVVMEQVDASDVLQGFEQLAKEGMILAGERRKLTEKLKGGRGCKKLHAASKPTLIMRMEQEKHLNEMIGIYRNAVKTTVNALKETSHRIRKESDLAFLDEAPSFVEIEEDPSQATFEITKKVEVCTAANADHQTVGKTITNTGVCETNFHKDICQVDETEENHDVKVCTAANGKDAIEETLHDKEACKTNMHSNASHINEATVAVKYEPEVHTRTTTSGEDIEQLQDAMVRPSNQHKKLYQIDEDDTTTKDAITSDGTPQSSALQQNTEHSALIQPLRSDPTNTETQKPANEPKLEDDQTKEGKLTTAAKECLSVSLIQWRILRNLTRHKIATEMSTINTVLVLFQRWGIERVKTCVNVLNGFSDVLCDFHFNSSGGKKFVGDVAQTVGVENLFWNWISKSLQPFACSSNILVRRYLQLNLSDVMDTRKAKAIAKYDTLFMSGTRKHPVRQLTIKDANRVNCTETCAEMNEDCDILVLDAAEAYDFSSDLLTECMDFFNKEENESYM